MLKDYAPIFRADSYSNEDRWLISPFFTNLDQSVYAPLIFSPELVGALCSRASRASEDLRKIFLNEFIKPFVSPQREAKESETEFKEKIKHGRELLRFIEFLHSHPVTEIFSNPKARAFYAKWLAQYGDDSIAQMAGAHIVFWGLSQVTIKHLEDQRIGSAPIEKSTRYVDYSRKLNGHYLYYTDPTLKKMGLESEYRAAMDGLFETYVRSIPKFTAWLAKKFPEEKPIVIEKKAFDTLRGLLPASTLSQVAFFMNGQAMEYSIARSVKEALGEIRWAAERMYDELNKIAPSFLRRLKDPFKKEIVEEYQRYKAETRKRMDPFVKKHFGNPIAEFVTALSSKPKVKLINYSPQGEEEIITGMLYTAPHNHQPWEKIFLGVSRLTEEEKRNIIAEYLRGRTARWQKVGRAFENADLRYEIVMNIGAWRDLHRHRLMSQQRQYFSCYHGYDVPQELKKAGLEEEFKRAIGGAEKVFYKIAKSDPDIAQYAVTLAHRIRFMVKLNVRQFFWLAELRTIPEGHPDYRHIVQEMFRQFEKVYPLIAEHMRVNMGEYDFARRGQEEKIQEKFRRLTS